MTKIRLLYVKGREKCEWLVYSIAMIETLDTDFKNINSLHNLLLMLLILILYDVENMLKIMRYRMYLKYTGGRNARKNISSLKNKV